MENRILRILLNLTITEILKEPNYYLENKHLYLDYVSMLQNSLQGELENSEISDQQTHLLGFLNSLTWKQ